jgi:hypothetical protein
MLNNKNKYRLPGMLFIKKIMFLSAHKVHPTDFLVA